ncbi:hypothetical protein FA95DRAFT_1346161 [Auriscalpium vulgare]|uniref:Uncharacterized protein n=1 Tax=Auriscalpium vulgare TaxID=40419 RepID=A0ACB8RRD7_9AGAM|nr:hypothetical protein FA95DRAFT_1346161 [Auriscalpium vulgare]
MILEKAEAHDFLGLTCHRMDGNAPHLRGAISMLVAGQKALAWLDDNSEHNAPAHISRRPRESPFASSSRRATHKVIALHHKHHSCTTLPFYFLCHPFPSVINSTIAAPLAPTRAELQCTRQPLSVLSGHRFSLARLGHSLRAGQAARARH